MSTIAITCTLLAAVAAPRSAVEARYAFLPEAVATADAVAVVEITKSENIAVRWGEGDPKRIGPWRYAQKNSFRFVELVKHAPFVALPESDQTLWAEKDFICASITYQPGRYLVFLEWVAPDEWVTVNHEMGALRIEEGVIEWPYTEAPGAGRGAAPSFGAKTPRTLDQVRAEVVAAFCDGDPFTLVVQVHKSHENTLTRWVPEHSHQALTIHVSKPPRKAWPKGAWPGIMRAWLETERFERSWYEDLLREGGELRVTAQWRAGNLQIIGID